MSTIVHFDIIFLQNCQYFNFIKYFVLHRLSKRHTKRHLTTPFGRAVELVTYPKLIAITFFTWLLSSIYFSVATYFDNGINLDPAKIGKIEVILSSMYFSGVTITTLGYGDILPVGLGRLFAIILAICGLILFAMLITKISGERQSSLLVLLHTSDIERRVSAFSEEVDGYNKAIQVLAQNNDVAALNVTLKNLKTLIEISNKYMVFHVFQSVFLEVGNNTALRRLITRFVECHDIILNISGISKEDERIERVCLSISKKFISIERMLVRTIESKDIDNEGLNTSKLTERHQQLILWQSRTVTAWLKRRVKEKLPVGDRQNWPRHLYKDIAKEIGVSNNLVIKCIDEMKLQGMC